MKYNISNMMSLDIYLDSVQDIDYKNISSETSSTDQSIMPLMSWDIFNEDFSTTIENSKILNDIEQVKSFAKKSKWKNKIDGIFENQDFEALVITDINQKILWVNNGFTEMTGYSKKFAINKTPNFLQGENTQRTTKKRIRNKLELLEPFTEVITNYRKDKTPYKCEVKIIPLYKEKVTHFLAIERKVV